MASEKRKGKMKIPGRLELAHLPTPLEKVRFRTSRNDKTGIEFLIKRDDYTGSDFLGNKIRKLEYLLYEAKKLKSEELVIDSKGFLAAINDARGGIISRGET